MIRNMLAIGLLCLASLAFAPATMAAPDICTFELMPTHSVDYAIDLSAPDCDAVQVLATDLAQTDPGGDDDDAAAPCKATSRAEGAVTSRQRFDPGRCPV